MPEFWKRGGSAREGSVTGYEGRSAQYPHRMKKLILLGVLAAIAAVVYKVLTTEIPIDDA